jgi:hypothetical protein
LLRPAEGKQCRTCEGRDCYCKISQPHLLRSNSTITCPLETTLLLPARALRQIKGIGLYVRTAYRSALVAMACCSRSTPIAAGDLVGDQTVVTS